MTTHNSDNELLTELAAATRRMGIDIEVTASKGKARTPALQLLLRFGAQELRISAGVMRGLRASALDEAVRLSAKQGVVLTDFVSTQLADELRSRGVEFIDSAGNAFLQRPPLLIWVKGERASPAARTMQTVGRAFRAAGLHVIFALLRRPELVGHSQRELARLTGVAHGTVGGVLSELLEAGFIVEGDKKRRQLHNMRNLLDLWSEAYAQVLRPKLLLGRYRAPSSDWWERIDAHNYGVQLGGESAAALLTEDLHPAVTTFYTDKLPAKLLAEHQLQEDPEGDVEIRQRFWNFEQVWNYPALVPPVLIYADLLACGEARYTAAAKAVYDEYLARAIG